VQLRPIGSGPQSASTVSAIDKRSFLLAQIFVCPAKGRPTGG
jgi:hypothetical protein